MSTAVIERPQADTAEADYLNLEGIRLKREEIGDPAGFLASDRGKAWLAPILSGAYFTRWYEGSQRGPYELTFCNKIAAKVLEAKYNGACQGEIDNLLEEHFDHGHEPEDAYREEHERDIEQKLEGLAEDIADLGDDTLAEMDVEAWGDEIRDIVIDHMCNDDDSTVMDMFGSYDRFEMVVRFDPNNNYMQIDASGPDFDHLVIDQALRNNLAGLGYTIGDYRRMTGNRRKGYKNKRQRPVRAQPLVTEDQLRSLIAESCGTSCSFVLYASIPLTDIFELDVGKPVVLSRCAVASYNSMNGTYFDVSHEQSLIIDPRHDRITEAWGYRPEDICGLHMPHYHARLANVA